MGNGVVATRFSRHAFDRVEERLTIPKAEVAAILDSGEAVPIGSETGSSRLHRLFYSIPDDTCFVAVQDERSGTVVTVLPVDYHERCSWAVTPPARREARSLAQCFDPVIDRAFYDYLGMDLTCAGYDPQHDEPSTCGPVPDTGPAPREGDNGDRAGEGSAKKLVFHLRGWRGSFDIVNLGSWPGSSAMATAYALLSDAAFLVALRDRMIEAGADITLGVSVRPRGTASPVHLKGLSAAFDWAEHAVRDEAERSG